MLLSRDWLVDVLLEHPSDFDAIVACEAYSRAVIGLSIKCLFLTTAKSAKDSSSVVSILLVKMNQMCPKVQAPEISDEAVCPLSSHKQPQITHLLPPQPEVAQRRRGCGRPYSYLDIIGSCLPKPVQAVSSSMPTKPIIS